VLGGVSSFPLNMAICKRMLTGMRMRCPVDVNLQQRMRKTQLITSAQKPMMDPSYQPPTQAVCHVILAGRWMVGLVSGKKSSEVLKGIIMNCCNYG